MDPYLDGDDDDGGPRECCLRTEKLFCKYCNYTYYSVPAELFEHC